MLQIPLVEGLNKTVTTQIDGKTYTFNTNWNSRFEYYSMNVSINGVEVISGLTLVSGVDLGTISALGLTNVFCVNINESNEDIGYTGLGDDGLVAIVYESDLEE